MKTYAFRLTQGTDLKNELKAFVKQNSIQAGIILTCVGCLDYAVIRMAGGKTIKQFPERFEIVSLVGTISQEDSRIHISISDINGNTYGGHIVEGCIVGTTAEIVIGELENVIFITELDKNTGYKELQIIHK